MLNIDWKQLKADYTALSDEFPEEIVVYYSIKGGRAPISKQISSENFMKFVWRLHDNDKIKIDYFIVADNSGDILYRHGPVNKGGEILPTSGNPYIVQVWDKMDPDSRSFWLKILLTEIDYETQHESEFIETRTMGEFDREIEG